MRARSSILASIVALVLVGAIDRAEALRAAPPYAIALLAPLGQPRDPLADPDMITGRVAVTRGVTVTPDGALVVTDRPAGVRGNRDPSAVRLTDAGGAAIRTRLEEIAPDLHRIVPVRRLARGTIRVRGIPSVTSVRVGGSAPPIAGAPSIEHVTNHRTPLDPQQPAGPLSERVVVSLRELAPPSAVLLVARWVDWHDDEGGLYGTWTEVPAGTRELVLICNAGPPCVTPEGHIPRANERGELRWVDANGRLSDATTVTVTTAP